MANATASRGIRPSPGIDYVSEGVDRPAEDAEILAVVDERDEVIGEERRDRIHEEALRHRAIHVLIFNSAEEVFLQKRGMHKKENPGLWDSSVAGHVDAGETYDACCVREVDEEVGLKLRGVPPRLFKLEATEVTGMEFAWVYRVDSDGPLTPNLDEMSEGRWFSRAEIEAKLAKANEEVSEVFRLIWETYRPMWGVG